VSSINKPPDRISLGIATMLGLGYAPVASGTVGSLGAVLLHYLFFAGLPPLTYVLLWMNIFVVACYVSDVVARDIGQDDPGIVVIDEAAGYLAAMFMLPMSPGYVVSAFLLFRLFDIVKPFPASYFDKKVQNGVGIVMDDVVAGLYANLAIQIFRLIAG